MEKIRILVVDDHPIIGEGLEHLLNLDPEMVVLGNAESGMKGLERLRKLNPDVVLLDLSMPQMSGQEAIRLYREANPRVKILVFSGHREEKFVHHALKSGAHGYVVKGSPLKELKQAIHYVREGGYWISPQFSSGIINKYLQSPKPDDSELHGFDQLSDREKQVFRLMVEGRGTEEISEILNISVNTVAKHRTSLMQKLDKKNIVELTKFAIRNGLIEA